MDQCNFTGRMVRDAEDIKGDGIRFTVAVERYDGGQKARVTEFVPFVAFGKVVQVIKDHAPKGKEVRVTSEYRTREYTPTQGPNAGMKVKDHSFFVTDFELLAGQPRGDGSSTSSTSAADDGGW